MRKLSYFLLSISLLSINLLAKENSSEKLQLVAKNIEAKDNVIIAKDDVIAYSPSYYISADKLIFDREKESLELFGNVLIIKDNKLQTQSKYAFLDMKNDLGTQDPIFLIDSSSNIWTNAKELTKEQEKLELVDSIISSCDCFDPAWSIRASSSNYDTKDMWVNTFNTRLYIKDIPIFYLPYFGFPTDTTRRTGLLFPTMGYGKSEGFLYSQSLFIAPKDNYDFEITPQVRTQRGYGVYGSFRYAATPDSILNIKSGYFKEKNSYLKDRDLLNDDKYNNQHYGISLDYEQKNILTTKNSSYEDGFFTSLNYLNDIEYLELSNLNGNVQSDRNVESKLNYYFNTPNYFTGTYLKYYIDTQAKSNKQTMQELPQIQLHSYNKSILFENLIYSADFKYQNLTREDGITAEVYNFNVPISYSRNIFNDHIFLGAESKTMFTNYIYDNYSNDKSFDNGTLVQNLTTLFIGTDLIKPYQNIIHTVNLSLNHEIPNNWYKDGDLHNVTVLEKENKKKYNDLKPFPTLQNKKRTIAKLNQSFYNKENSKQLINHQISQSIYYDDDDTAKLQDLENYLRLYYKNSTFSGRVVYNVADEKIVETSLDAKLDLENFSLNTGYYNSIKTYNEFFSRDDLESYRIEAKYKLNSSYALRYYENYDLEEKIRNRQGFGFEIDDSCWSLDLKYEKEIVPSSSSKYSNRRQNIVYATLVLKPIGGIKQNYKVYDSESR
ncbi:LPS-assembly protein LptD [Aliarcobacter thereius]|uniref:LPS-assembly protein LptD n=1 Tax=Aliarcobacter thereius LMG 24486 TaxID=1032240 RepID=A0A1C7WR09_9BACT|nr:LPS assembly protein LptD [Aliarcobacter thereius]OCL91149.1 LPS-assembly protein LptD precursor [Aliarcobacter thereius]OCL95998.1 LPS-assembly protein LptD precursor [Aliarcobacter thereius LMG 24486]QBF16030.1 putative lipooligosaccharide transport system, OM component LptD [Aliarcobacter thereius LMG 24486]TLS94627.1 LPS-assembly protein LptD [Aliarcobacter thereius]